MKKIYGVIGGLAAIGVLSYPGFGFLVEKGLRQQIEKIPKQYGLSVDLTDFKRHWFSSDVKLTCSWQIPAHLTQNAQGQTVTVSPQSYTKDFDIKIFHGPVVFQQGKFFMGVGYANTRLDWPLFSNLPGKDQFSKDSTFPQVDIKMALNFLFQTYWNTDVPAFSLVSLDNKTKLQWQGMSFNNKVGDDAKYLEGDIRFVGLNFTNNANLIRLTDLQSDYDFEKDDSGLYVGTGDFSFAEVDLTDSNNNKINLDNFNFHTSSEIEDKQFSSEFVMDLKKLRVNDLDMGPMELDFEVAKLNSGVLYRMHQMLQQEQNASPSFRQKNLWSMAASLPELVKYGLTVNLKKLHFVLNNGSIDSNGTVTIPASSDAVDALKALQNLQADWTIKVTQTLLVSWLSDLVEKQMSQQLPSDPASLGNQDLHQASISRINEKFALLVKSGVLIPQDSNYELRIKFQNGMLTVNDLKFDPSWLVI